MRNLKKTAEKPRGNRVAAADSRVPGAEQRRVRTADLIDKLRSSASAQ